MGPMEWARAGCAPAGGGSGGRRTAGGQQASGGGGGRLAALDRGRWRPVGSATESGDLHNRHHFLQTQTAVSDDDICSSVI